MNDDGSGDFELARITIVRYLRGGDGEDLYQVCATTPDGEQLSIVEALGLLELAKAELLTPAEVEEY